jgi:transglutaminase-like putative cysteine protease
MREYLNRKNFISIIISYAAIGMALFTNLMPLTIVLGCICVTWRSGNYYGLIKLPKPWLLIFISLLCTLSIVYWQYQQGLFSVMVNLIMLAFSLKFLELKTTRDVHVYVWTGLFLVAVYFIYHQSILLAVLGLLLVFLMLFVLITAHTNKSTYLAQFKQLLFASLMSLPLAIVLFMVIPRFPAFWGMPSQSKSETGLSDTVNPGDIAELSRSSEVAFRVLFSGEIPKPEERYWRVLTLDQYDGQTWSQSMHLQEEAKMALSLLNSSADKLIQVAGTENDNTYQLLMEGHNKHWLPSLDYAKAGVAMVRLNDFSLRYIKPIVNQQMITIEQAKQTPPMQLSNTEQLQFTKLARKDINLQTRLWLNQQSQQGKKNKQILDSLLIRFMEQEYHYTLKPPKLGDNQIDDFLFTNMKGFCVHYASSYIYVARSLGIPARMVTGYLGGELNEQTQFMTIRQYHAHAWAEIWHNGKWLRVDPTAYISPDRVEIGPMPTQNDADLMFNDMLSFDALGLAVDKLNIIWGTWIVNFDSEKQLDFLQGIVDEYKWLNSFYAILSLLLGAVVFIILLIFRPWDRRFIAKEDKYYTKLQKHYQYLGFKKITGETVTDYCLKVAQKNNNATTNLHEFACIYNRIKYQNDLSQDERNIALQQLAFILKKLFKKNNS